MSYLDDEIMLKEGDIFMDAELDVDAEDDDVDADLLDDEVADDDIFGGDDKGI